MIRFLSIRDLAVVDRIEVEFSDGFNVLTGETGAGKSIIVGALGLLVGGRATNDLVRTGCEKAVIEGTFEHLSGDECIVRREISVHGRSRIFIDDALATVGKLKELGRSLVDISNVLVFAGRVPCSGAECRVRGGPVRIVGTG